MRIIETDDDFRRAVEKVLLRAEDMVQQFDTEGQLLQQWSLQTSPDLKNVGSESIEVLRQLTQKFVRYTCVCYSTADPKQAPCSCRRIQPRRAALDYGTES